MFALVVDTSQSNAGRADSIKQAAFAIFRDLSLGGHRGYLVVFNQSVRASTEPLPVSRAQSLLDSVQFVGGTAIFDAVELTCLRELSRSRNPNTPRRVMVLISDGGDNQSHVTPTAAEEAAQKEGVAVFSLIPESASGERQGERVMKKLSQDTGGRGIGVKNPADGVAPLIAAIENQWALSFVPAQPLDQKQHSLGIKTSQKDIRVSAPAYIFVP